MGMTTRTWKLGLVECHDPSVGEVELLRTDMDGGLLLIVYRKHGAEYWSPATLGEDGRVNARRDTWYDLVPPKMARREMIAACFSAATRCDGNHFDEIRAVINCYDELIKSGRYVP